MNKQLFSRDEVERIALQKIAIVNEEAGYRPYLEVPEMVEIITASIEEIIHQKDFLPDFVDCLIDIQNK
jgi:hypothetical protein